MDFEDKLVSRFDGEAELRKNNALICFSIVETGKALSRLAIRVIRSKSSEKGFISLLYFMEGPEDIRLREEADLHKIFMEDMTADEREKITLRVFIESADNSYEKIARIAEEQKTDLVLLGLNSNEFDPQLFKKFGQLKNNPSHSESFILEQFEPKYAGTLKNINALFTRNSLSTGLFMDMGALQFRNVFVPILQKSDVHIFTYLYRMAQQENVKIMIWDAIGIIESDAKMQKLYQLTAKRTEGRILLWNNNKKIECDFIQDQDLIIIGMGGWNKLICTPLPWTGCLPSTLIIKEATNFN